MSEGGREVREGGRDRQRGREGGGERVREEVREGGRDREGGREKEQGDDTLNSDNQASHPMYCIVHESIV